MRGPLVGQFKPGQLTQGARALAHQNFEAGDSDLRLKQTAMLANNPTKDLLCNQHSDPECPQIRLTWQPCLHGAPPCPKRQRQVTNPNCIPTNACTCRPSTRAASHPSCWGAESSKFTSLGGTGDVGYPLAHHQPLHQPPNKCVHKPATQLMRPPASHRFKTLRPPLHLLGWTGGSSTVSTMWTMDCSGERKAAGSSGECQRGGLGACQWQ